MSTEGRKNDQQKDPWHLAPWDAFRAIVSVLAFGANKYGARNWENGMAWSRLFAALHRHLASWWEGEATDPETGLSHLWHAGCCVMFLISFEIRGVGTDDRFCRWEQSRKDKSGAQAAVDDERVRNDAVVTDKQTTRL